MSKRSKLRKRERDLERKTGHSTGNPVLVDSLNIEDINSEELVLARIKADENQPVSTYDPSGRQWVGGKKNRSNYKTSR